MADTTLEITIRVNDETRAALNRANVEIRRLSRELKKAGGAASQTDRLNRSLQRTGRAAQRAQLQSQSFFRGLRRGFNQANVGFGRLRTQFNNLRIAFGTLAAAAGAAGLGAALVRQADAALQLQARLKVVADTEEDRIRIGNRLLDVSQETRTSVLENAKVFARLSLATEELGTTEDELITIVSGLNKAVLLSGATAQEANAGLIQLSQGIASNRFQGDELRSVLENLIIVGEELSIGLGTNIAGLRELGEQGLLTREQLVPALIQISEAVEDRFQRLPVTVGQAGIRIQNALLAAFTGEEIQPLVDALNSLALELRDPATIQAIRDLTRAVSEFAAVSVRSAIAVKEGFQGARDTIGEFIDFLEDKGINTARLFGDALLNALPPQLRAVAELLALRKELNKERDAVIGLADTEARVQAEINRLDEQNTQARLERRREVVRVEQEAAKETVNIAKRANREVERDLKRNTDRVKELRDEIRELEAPQRAEDPFIAQTQRFAELRRIEQLIREDRFKEAGEIAAALIKEAEQLDDVIQREFVRNRAVELRKQAAIEEAEALVRQNEELARQRELNKGIIKDRGEIPEPVEALVIDEDAEGQFARTAEESDNLADSLKETRQVAETSLPPVVTALTVIEGQAKAAALEVDNLNAQLESLGQTAATIPSLALGGTVGVRGQTGGFIPGFGGGDRVPARLEKGEFVINKQSTRRFFPLLAAINRGARDISGFFPLRRFAAGGLVPGDVTSSLMASPALAGTGNQQVSETVRLDLSTNGAPLTSLRGTRENVIALTKFLQGFQNNIPGR